MNILVQSKSKPSTIAYQMTNVLRKERLTSGRLTRSVILLGNTHRKMGLQPQQDIISPNAQVSMKAQYEDSNLVLKKSLRLQQKRKLTHDRNCRFNPRVDHLDIVNCRNSRRFEKINRISVFLSNCKCDREVGYSP